MSEHWLNDIYQQLDPIAFSLGPFSVRWYGLAYLAGFLCTFFVMRSLARRFKLAIGDEELSDVMVGIMLGVIVGARLGYVIFYGAGYYLQHPLSVFALAEGGMSFHGGLLGAIIGGGIACKLHGLSVLEVADLAACGAPLGLFFGRIANFINGELWGKETDLVWGVMFETGGGVYRHPSQLYEALLEGLVLFLILFVLSRKKPSLPRGSYLAVFLMGYGVFRALIEFVRVPDAQLGYLLGPITMGQLLSLPLILAGALLFWHASSREVLD